MFYEYNYFFNKNGNTLKDLAFLLNRSELLKLFAEEKLVNTFFEPPDMYFTDDHHLAFYKTLAYASNVSIMAFLSQNLGVKFTAVFQPIVAFRTQLYGDEERFRHGNTPEILKQRDFLFSLMGTSKFSSTPIADCSHVFDSVNQQIFRDVIHVDAEGQKIVAECIFDHFKKDLNATSPRVKPVFLPEDFFVTGVPDLKAFLIEFASIDIQRFL